MVPKKTEGLKAEKARVLGASICAELNKNKTEDVVVKALSKNDASLFLVEGLALANYQFLKYFKDKEAKSNSLKNIFVEDKNITASKIDEMWNVVDATFKARDWVNEPLSYLTAEQLANEFEMMGVEANVKVEVLDQVKIETLKMGGLLAVNQGSLDPATFTIMEWKPKNAKNKKPIVLVGKGCLLYTSPSPRDA